MKHWRDLDMAPYGKKGAQRVVTAPQKLETTAPAVNSKPLLTPDGHGEKPSWRNGWHKLFSVSGETWWVKGKLGVRDRAWESRKAEYETPVADAIALLGALDWILAWNKPLMLEVYLVKTLKVSVPDEGRPKYTAEDFGILHTLHKKGKARLIHEARLKFGGNSISLHNVGRALRRAELKKKKPEKEEL